MSRIIVSGIVLNAMAGLVELATLETLGRSHDIILQPRELQPRVLSEPMFPEISRSERRANARSKKRYKLKGIRP